MGEHNVKREADPEELRVFMKALLRDVRVSCLPVVNKGKLVGLITEHDFLKITRDLLEERLANTPSH